VPIIPLAPGRFSTHGHAMRFADVVCHQPGNGISAGAGRHRHDQANVPAGLTCSTLAKKSDCDPSKKYCCDGPSISH